MYIFLKSYILKSSVHTLNHEHPDSRPNKKFVNFYFHSSFVVPEKGLYALMNGHFPFWPKTDICIITYLGLSKVNLRS